MDMIDLEECFRPLSGLFFSDVWEEIVDLEEVEFPSPLGVIFFRYVIAPGSTVRIEYNGFPSPLGVIFFRYFLGVLQSSC